MAQSEFEPPQRFFCERRVYTWLVFLVLLLLLIGFWWQLTRSFDRYFGEMIDGGTTSGASAHNATVPDTVDVRTAPIFAVATAGLVGSPFGYGPYLAAFGLLPATNLLNEMQGEWQVESSEGNGQNKVLFKSNGTFVGDPVGVVFTFRKGSWSVDLRVYERILGPKSSS